MYELVAQWIYGLALAGKNTLNRLARAPIGDGSASRYKKIVAHQTMIERLFVDLFI